ncbi:MAG: FtsQ-type POTRA domain-containing protein [Ruthenibacterium sp.]
MAQQPPKRSQYPVNAPSAKKPPQRPVYDFQTPGAQTGRTKPANRPVYDYKQENEKRVPMQRVPETPLPSAAQQATRQTAAPKKTVQGAHPPFDQKQAMRPSQKPRQSGEMKQMVLPLGVVQAPPQRRTSQPAQRSPQQNAAKTAVSVPKSAPQKPRTVAPKKQVKKPLTYGEARRRRRNRNLIAGCAVAVVLAIGIVLSFTVLFKIQTIEITGDSPYTQEQILTAFAHQAGDNLFSFPIQTAQNTLTTALPYLESVTISRHLPDKIEIATTTAVDTYLLNTASGWAVLSASFKVLRVEAEPVAGPILLLGAETETPVPGQPLQLTDAEKQHALQTVTAELAKQELAPVSEIDITNTLELSFLYDNRIRVLLGTINELDAKIDWAKYLCVPGTSEQSRAATDRGTLDVSSRNAEGRLKAGWTAGTL